MTKDSTFRVRVIRIYSERQVLENASVPSVAFVPFCTICRICRICRVLAHLSLFERFVVCSSIRGGDVRAQKEFLMVCAIQFARRDYGGKVEKGIGMPPIDSQWLIFMLCSCFVHAWGVHG